MVLLDSHDTDREKSARGEMVRGFFLVCAQLRVELYGDPMFLPAFGLN